MFGGVIGDYIGSVFEGIRIKSYNYQHLISFHSEITDDSVMLCGTAEAIMTDFDFVRSYRKWGRKHWDVGYSPTTRDWINDDSLEYKNPNPGNGAAARAGIIGYLDLSEGGILSLARASAEASHSHEEAIQGAEAVALCIYLIRKQVSSKSIIDILYKKFEYYIDYDLNELHKNWYFDASAFNCVPVALFIGLNAKSYEDAIRTCLYIGGDADTIAAIAGLVVQARMGVCEKLKLETQKYLFKRANDVLLISQQFEAAYL